MNDFTGYSRPLHVNTCTCDWCESKRAMRAATCKCGHVGAECFNDSYCEPQIGFVPNFTTSDSYARNLENQCNSLDSLLQNANDEIAATQDAINDLQADYAADCVSWCAMYNAVIDPETYNEDQDRIEELETTIRVLAGMID